MEKLTVSTKKYKGETSVISLRMPNELISKLDKVCDNTGRTRNEIIIKGLDFALDNIVIEGEEND